jgi:hypothetical protein
MDDLAGAVEQFVNRILKPLGIVMLTRERIQEVLDEAAERGRVTRSDANDLVSELVKRGREQTDELLSDLSGLVGRGIGRGRDQLEAVTWRARRTVGVEGAFPIAGYDELTAGQVQEQLDGLTPAELRRVRDYERRHANRKSALAAIEKRLG